MLRGSKNRVDIHNRKDEGYWMFNGISIPTFMIDKLLTEYTYYLLKNKHIDSSLLGKEIEMVDTFMNEFCVDIILEKY